MNLRDIVCPTLDLTRLSKRFRTFRSEFAKVADSGRSAKVSYRALSLEAMRLVVRQFLKWPAEAFPRGRHPWPCWNFLNLLPAAQTFRTSWKIARVSLHGHSFSGAISSSRFEASKQLSQLVAVFDFDLRLHGGKRLAE